jgi:hypothetical protein
MTIVGRFSLSSRGLQRLAGSVCEKDFRFLVGDEAYRCPSLIAEFLSPRVSELRSSDATIDEFRVEVEDPNHSFSVFLSLGFGFGVELKRDEVDFCRSVCEELWNLELFDLLHSEGENSSNHGGLLARLNFLSRLRGNVGEDLNLESIASHFYEFSVSDCRDLGTNVLEAIMNEPHLVLASEDSLYEIISDHVRRDRSSFSLLEFVRFEYLSVSFMESAVGLISDSFELLNMPVWKNLVNRLILTVQPPHLDSRLFGRLDSNIISSFPPSLKMLRESELKLLYRGSRDGFETSAFHGRCDGHRETVTVIESENGSIFGGYTPVVWQSSGSHLTDDSVKSFLFTIKNPHGLPPQLFPLKEDHKSSAIFCASRSGPSFGGGSDLYICTQSNASNQSYTNFGHSYNNSTGFTGHTVLTGEYNFIVREIEVFEVIGKIPDFGHH